MNGLRKCTIEHYTAVKKYKVGAFLAKWVQLENITLTETTLIHKEREF